MLDCVNFISDNYLKMTNLLASFNGWTSDQKFLTIFETLYERCKDSCNLKSCENYGQFFYKLLLNLKFVSKIPSRQKFFRFVANFSC